MPGRAVRHGPRTRSASRFTGTRRRRVPRPRRPGSGGVDQRAARDAHSVGERHADGARALARDADDLAVDLVRRSVRAAPHVEAEQRMASNQPSPVPPDAASRRSYILSRRRSCRASATWSMSAISAPSPSPRPGSKFMSGCRSRSRAAGGAASRPPDDGLCAPKRFFRSQKN